MIRRRLKSLARRALTAAGYQKIPAPPAPPALEPLSCGEAPSAGSAPLLDALPDGELRRLNALLPWAAFVVDGKQRRFGRPYAAHKRSSPQVIPDPRIAAWDAKTPLEGRSVLEVGCFEGLHTVALCQRGAEVTAVDGRIENVVKTLTRCALFDVWPRVLRWDLEGEPPTGVELGWDLVHHVGVLYHLSNPLEHLASLASWTREELLLDTHVAPPGAQLEELGHGELRARAWTFAEGTREAPFAGLRTQARWLVQEDLVAVLQTLFGAVELVARREERNGPRVLLYARK